MEKRFNILIKEKDPNVGALLQECLPNEDFHIEVSFDVNETRNKFNTGEYPVCIINLDPATIEEEFTLAKDIKAMNNHTVLIFLCHNPAKNIILQAYSLYAADDFIKKPFNLDELRARIYAILRRTHNVREKETNLYHIGKYIFDSHKQTLTIAGETRKVTTKECELLKYMCEHMNQLVERKDILKNIWRNDTYFNARSMDVYITN
ncbi:MAG: response regulator transcription factor [Tannerellaceae bacterium]|nr:response regulator transcription factor [Tannerellaceae bacterium]